VAGEAVSAAGAQTAEQKLAAGHRALKAAKNIQFDFGSVPPPPKTPEWLKALGRFLEAIAPGLQYVFWGAVIVGLALILYFIVREFAPESWFRGRRTTPVATDWRPDEAQARALLEDADRLAAAGQFEAAIHILLFRSIDDLAARRPGVVRPAFTSRDIAGLEVLPPAAREAFARLAQAVERTFFGGRSAGAEEFGRARADYEAFAFAENWR